MLIFIKFSMCVWLGLICIAEVKEEVKRANNPKDYKFHIIKPIIHESIPITVANKTNIVIKDIVADKKENEKKQPKKNHAIDTVYLAPEKTCIVEVPDTSILRERLRQLRLESKIIVTKHE